MLLTFFRTWIPLPGRRRSYVTRTRENATGHRANKGGRNTRESENRLRARAHNPPLPSILLANVESLYNKLSSSSFSEGHQRLQHSLLHGDMALSWSTWRHQFTVRFLLCFDQTERRIRVNLNLFQLVSFLFSGPRAHVHCLLALLSTAQVFIPSLLSLFTFLHNRTLRKF